MIPSLRKVVMCKLTNLHVYIIPPHATHLNLIYLEISTCMDITLSCYPSVN